MPPHCERSESCEGSHPWAEPARPAVAAEDVTPSPGPGTPSTAGRVGGYSARCGAPLSSLLSRARRAKAASRRASQLTAASQVSAGRPAVGTAMHRTRPSARKAWSARVIGSAGRLGRAARRGPEARRAFPRTVRAGTLGDGAAVRRLQGGDRRGRTVADHPQLFPVRIADPAIRRGDRHSAERRRGGAQRGRERRYGGAHERRAVGRNGQKARPPPRSNGSLVMARLAAARLAAVCCHRSGSARPLKPGSVRRR